MKTTLSALAFTAFGFGVLAQQNGPSITGNIESIFQYLNDDPVIDAVQPAQKGLLNSYMNVFYNDGTFKAGIRFESYLPRIQGYPANFDGTGLGMRYVGYQNDFVDVTIGSIYEQFGNGLAFRTYEDRALGYDNFLDGARVIIKPGKGLKIKGVYGYQRLSFLEGRIEHSKGIVRGIDAEWNINSLKDSWKEKKFNVTVGTSFVSKYQRDDREDLVLPENVGAYGGRIKMRYGKFTLDAEHIIKEQDPSFDNKEIYNYGHATVINFGYSKKGLGIMLNAKSVDNMSFRSDRDEKLQNALINFLPSMNKVHSYNLVASLYPWATQPVGEIAFQGEVVYTVKNESPIFGKYGTTFNANVSAAFMPKRDYSVYNPVDSNGIAYRTGVFQMTDSLYWRDINVNIYRKLNKSLNVRLSYFNISMNNDVNKVADYGKGIITSNIAVLEVGYKINKKHSLRGELQALFINSVDLHLTSGEEVRVLNDKGNWLTGLVEYNVSPHWFFSVMDQINMENKASVYSMNVIKDPDVKDTDLFGISLPGVHHFYFSVGYIRESTRISIGYGRQRAGLFCVGGICRTVPASNGLTVSFTQSF